MVDGIAINKCLHYAHPHLTLPISAFTWHCYISKWAPATQFRPIVALNCIAAILRTRIHLVTLGFNAHSNTSA